MFRYDFKNVLNCRDLGGYQTPNGQIKNNMIIRSDLLYEMEINEINALLYNKITTIIDLRMSAELEIRENALKNHPAFKYHNISLFDHYMKFEKEEDMPLRYMESVENYPATKEIFNIITNCENGVLFHCTAGKDRTGIISALLLKLCGVKDEDIASNYAISKELLVKKEAQFKAENKGDYPAFIGNSKPEYILNFLKLFLAKYQSVENYLRLLDVDVDKLKDKLIQA